MSDENELIVPGRPPRDDRFLFGDPSEARNAPEVFSGLQPRHLAIDPESQPSGEWAQRTVRGSLPLLMTGTLAAGVGVTSAIPAQATPEPTQPHTDDTRVQKVKASLRIHRPGLCAPLTTGCEDGGSARARHLSGPLGRHHHLGL